MSRRPGRRRGRFGRVDLALAVVLLGFCVFTWVWYAATHFAVGVGAGVAMAGTWEAGRWQERRRARKPPAPDPRVAELERLAARPIEAVISSYRTIQQKYRGGTP